jgi:pimeloyl-ACP methyl ester carboxylesterase
MVMRWVTAFVSMCLTFPALAGEVLVHRADGAETRLRIYGAGDGCARTALLSHGYGGGIDRTSVMAGGLAARGWRVIAVNHAESGGAERLRQAFRSGDLRGTLMRVASDAPSHRARIADIDAALSVALGVCRPRQLILIGHSMGAATAMIEAGATARNGVRGRDRFDAYVALSPQGVGYMFGEGAWRSVTKPVLMITGTADSGADGGWDTRLSAFEGLPPGRKRFAVLPGATHFQLSGTGQAGTIIAALVDEFAASVRVAGFAPSRISGVDVRDR